MRFHPKPLDTARNTVSQSGIMEHQRIDEGKPRGTYQAPAQWPQRKPPIAGKLGPDFDATPVLQRYLHGEELATIAADYGVHPKALNYHLLKEHIREAWRQAQVAVSLAEKQEAESVLRDAPDALSLGRAREVLRSAQWDLERLEHRLFGQQKAEININTDGPVTVQIVDFAAGAPQQLPQIAQITGNSDDKP